MQQKKERAKSEYKFSNKKLLSGKCIYNRWLIINYDTGETELDINNDPDQEMSIGHQHEVCCQLRLLGVLIVPCGTKFGLKRMKKTQTADELIGLDTARLRAEE